jgi:hypothetical protein
MQLRYVAKPENLSKKLKQLLFYCCCCCSRDHHDWQKMSLFSWLRTTTTTTTTTNGSLTDEGFWVSRVEKFRKCTSETAKARPLQKFIFLTPETT